VSSGSIEPTGPWIAAALICEKVLMETNGLISAVRILDRYIFILGPDSQPLAPVQPIFFLITLKSGEARGSHRIKIEREDPSTMRSPIVETDLFFEGEDRGAQLVLNGQFEPTEAGLYWYDVVLNDRLITRMSLRAIFQPQPTIGSGG
jgi:hypothetical protein